MKDYIKALDDCNIIIKILLALPFIDGLVYGLYRIFKGLVTNNTLTVVLGIIWIILGTTIGAIIDIISIVMYGKVKILA